MSSEIIQIMAWDNYDCFQHLSNIGFSFVWNFAKMWKIKKKRANIV
jgi:hypothetical protein